WHDGIFNTFNTSVIVWAAWISACYLALSADDRERIRPLDLVAACIAFSTAALPATSLSFVALSFFSAYVYLTSAKTPSLRRITIIFCAVCFPLLWGPELVPLAAPLLMKVDAFLVAAVTGAERAGNVIKFIAIGDAETIGGIQIWPGCSSQSNISHA